MGLFNALLANLKQKIQTHTNHCDTIALVLSSVLHTTILSSQVVYKKGVVVINTQPVVKIAITLKQQELIDACKAQSVVVYSIK